MVQAPLRHRRRPNLDLEEEVSRLEAELAVLSRTNIWQLERRVDRLLKLLDEPAAVETKGDRLRERLVTIAATAALSIAMMKSPIVTLFDQAPRQEQVSPKFSPSLAPGLGQVQESTAKPEAKFSAKPGGKTEPKLSPSLTPGLGQVQESTPKPTSKLSDFASKVQEVARNIKADPVDLLTLMSFETAGTLDPAKRGPHVPGQGQAVGLIQFMPATAVELGTSVEALAQMTQIEQLNYVQRYLLKRGFKGGTLKQLYSTVFAGHPNARGSVSDGYHTLDGAVERMNREHRPRAIEILGGTTENVVSKFATTKALISTWTEQLQADPKTGDIIAGYRVSSPRGMRTLNGVTRMHQGVDLSTPVGTPIYAIANGVLECEYWKDAGKTGLFTSAKFPGLRFDLLHLDSCLVKPGEKIEVREGQQLGTTGTWGTGPHLHLAIKSLDSGNFLRVRSGWLHWFVTGQEPKIND